MQYSQVLIFKDIQTTGNLTSQSKELILSIIGRRFRHLLSFTTSASPSCFSIALIQAFSSATFSAWLAAAKSLFFFSSSSLSQMAYLQSLICSSSSLQCFSSEACLSNLSALCCSSCRALRIPQAIELSYKVWNAYIVIFISSLTRTNRKPLSAQLIVTCRIISSKHCEYSSSLMGQMPVSLACRSCNFLSSSSYRLTTSRRVAGLGETYCTHSCPMS